MQFIDPELALLIDTISALEPAKPTRAGFRKLRTATLTILGAARVDTRNLLAEPKVPFDQSERHALVIWYDVAAHALRFFAPPIALLDETSASALELLNGANIVDFDRAPIEDVDAAARFMALLGQGGDDPGDLHARFIGRHLARFDEAFPPPHVEDFAELWGRILPTYVGGTTHPPRPGALDCWIEVVYAFGIGWAPPVG